MRGQEGGVVGERERLQTMNNFKGLVRLNYISIWKAKHIFKSTCPVCRKAGLHCNLGNTCFSRWYYYSQSVHLCVRGQVKVQDHNRCRVDGLKLTVMKLSNLHFYMGLDYANCGIDGKGASIYIQSPLKLLEGQFHFFCFC